MYSKKLSEDLRCPLEYGMSVIGGKWKSRIVCLLGNIGAMHFGELKTDLINISDGVLASALHELMLSKLIQKKSSEQTLTTVYTLTSKGMSLIPFLQALCRWSAPYYSDNHGIVMGHCRQCRFYKKWSEETDVEKMCKEISMEVNMKFFKCETCGNIVGLVKESGVPVMCCGKKMTELVPGTSDGAAEKHVPVYTVEGQKVVVTVGSAEHPMTEEHYIEWVALETAHGAQRKTLKPGDKPCIEFALTEDDSFVAVYAYCNLHGLWKSC